jgi:hypothetical protein
LRGKRLAAVFFLLLATLGVARAQRYPMRITPFRVERTNGDPYLNPFSGGLFQPRIGIRDADRDGLPDLFTLNPDNRLRYYRNLGGLSFQRIYPSPYDSLRLRKWFRFADIDGDGDDDILTSAALAQVLVYWNIGSQATPRFPAEPDTLRGEDGTPIIIQPETVPSLIDIDGNGTLDFFVGNPSDGTITFYRNTGTPTAPRFTYVTSRFMDISVISPGKVKKVDGGNGALAGTAMHGASVLGFGDIDGDGDLDLLFGDLFTKKLLLFRNTGSPTTPAFSMSTLDTAFRPNGSDVQSEGFNQAEVADLDHDGDPDVFVSSLHPQSSAQPVILYLNTAPGADPAIIRQPGDPTSEIDFGTYTAPVLIDDQSHHGVLIGSIDGTIAYFELQVEGGKTIWRQRSQTVIPGVFQVAPAAADLDGDGRAEVVVGDAEGYLRLYHYQGTVLIQQAWQLDTFKLGQYSSPTLVDFDRDGDFDLFVGGGNGRFVYFENTGTSTAPRFERRTPPTPFDTLDVDNDSAPRFYDLDGDGDLDAIVGGRTSSGYNASVDTVRFYLNDGGRFIESPEYPELLAVRSPVPMILPAPEGTYLILGNQAGGLAAFELAGPSGRVEQSAAAGGTPWSVTVSPSFAAGGGIDVAWRLPDPDAHLLLCDEVGREVARIGLPETSGSRRIALPELAPGVYFYRIAGVPVPLGGRILIHP